MTDKKKFIFSNLLSLVLGIVIGAGGLRDSQQYQDK